ncbi:ArsR/SmtB family transcription factor [Actinomadura fibrosa]|uniref:ArsR/SmtB family transcription factor n=1 Tax=Actinomadura fibrosa TaxID=111802 RepID=A0ABW2XX88_9ACTN|nr:helix-turn-helix domain-containing protein [Actinomadura fibrosa]
MLRIHFTRDDLMRLRVAHAPDPLWETLLSLHALQGRQCSGPVKEWRGQILGAPAERLNEVLEYLVPLAPIAPYVPDFLTPFDASMGLEAGIEAVMCTSRRRLREELGTLAALKPLPSWTRDLGEGRHETLLMLGQALRTYHAVALRPHWHRIHLVFDAERAIRGQALLNGGTERLLRGLAPLMRWQWPVLEVDYPRDRNLRLDGRGLTLIPSFFCRGTPIGLADPELPPVLVYPIQHAGMRSERGDAAADLAPLLGANRAAILAAARAGRSTGELARMLAISPATVSYHVAVLRDAGLITSHRDANVVVHTTTPLGASLHRPKKGVR